MSSRKSNVLELVDFAIIRRAKTREVKVKDVKNGIITFEIDKVKVTASKDRGGYLEFRCRCSFCKKGYNLRNTNPTHPTIRIVNKIICSRQLAAYWFLIRHNGRISECLTSWKYKKSATNKPRRRDNSKDSPDK